MNRKYKAAIFLIIALLATGTFALTRMGAAEQLFPTLYIDPSQVVFNSLVVGQRFDVNITVMNVTDLKSYDFTLSFNPNMLSVVTETFLPEANLPTPNCIVNARAGTFWANVTYETPIDTVPPVTVATIKFRVMNYGISPLTFSNDKLSNTTGLLMQHATTGGSVSVLNHDVAIISLSTSTNETYEGRTVNINATAKNLGLAPENFTLTIYAGSNLIGTLEILNLSPNETTFLATAWNTTGFANLNQYAMTAQASPVPFETNLTNNALTDGTIKIKIMGDVNGDGTVSILDLEAWDAAYGSTEGTPNWNPQADLNNNGTVDKEDGKIIIDNYGNHL